MSRAPSYPRRTSSASLKIREYHAGPGRQWVVVKERGRDQSGEIVSRPFPEKQQAIDCMRQMRL